MSSIIGAKHSFLKPPPLFVFKNVTRGKKKPEKMLDLREFIPLWQRKNFSPQRPIHSDSDHVFLSAKWKFLLLASSSFIVSLLTYLEDEADAEEGREGWSTDKEIIEKAMRLQISAGIESDETRKLCKYLLRFENMAKLKIAVEQ